MRRRRDPLVKLALRLHRQFRTRDPVHERRLETLAEAVIYHTHRLEHQLRLGRQTRLRDWPVATAVVEQNQLDLLRHLRYLLNETPASLERPVTVKVPTLRDWHEELVALGQEFDSVHIDDGNLLAVTTDSIELEDVPLGPFRIELALEKLGRRPDVSAFHIVALEPNPAAGKDDITHPHVSGGQLCAGDATLPIASALKEGRLCDAFTLVNQVLHTYNGGSPYVSLSEWTGRSCQDCGSHVPEDEGYGCERCGGDYCSDCIRFCDHCDSAACGNCTEEDRETGRLLCRRCQRRCGTCGRMVDPEQYCDDSGLCPACEEARQQEQEQEVQEPEEQEPEEQEQEEQASVTMTHSSPTTGE